MNPQFEHIPRPVKRGNVIPYQTGWAFTVVGSCGNDYTIRNVTYPSAAEAKQAMRKFVDELNAEKNNV
jgi:hypothetical protein